MEKRLLASLVIATTCLAVSLRLSAAETGSGALTKQCGPAKMTIRCSSESSDCNKTTLSIQTSNGISKLLGKPKGLGEYTAIGLACATSANHTDYFVVQYGERPFGCKFCEWFHLYSTNGELLTHSDPPVLIDTSLQPTQQHYPNNEEYDAMAKRLGLNEEEIQFIR